MSFPTKNTVYVACFLSSILFLPAMALPQPSSREFKEGSLVLSLTVPPSVNDVKDIIITGTLENKDTKDMLVVKDPNGILYDFFVADALVFERTDTTAKDAIKNPTFVGNMAKWDMKTYLRNNDVEDVDEHDYPKDAVSLGNKSRTRRGSEDSSGQSGSLSNNKSSVAGSSESEDKKYPPGKTLDLLAGKTIKFNYKAGDVYDFRKSGAGAYTFKLKRNFFYVLVQVDDVIKYLKLDVKVDAYTIEIDGKLEANVPEPEDFTPNDKTTENDTIDGRDIIQRAPKVRAATQNCSKDEKSDINSAAQHADRYVSEANEYLSAMTRTTYRYATWFGDWNTQTRVPYTDWRPRDQVIAMFESLGRRSFRGPGYIYDCSCDDDIHAYISRRFDLPPPEVGRINLCEGFRAESTPLTGFNSKAGTLVHEGSHFTWHKWWTEDHAVGYYQSHQLALDDPFLASTNSDSYTYFAENTPFQE